MPVDKRHTYRIGFGLILVALLLAGFLVFFVWFNRSPDQNSIVRQTDIRITSAELIDSFRNNEIAANTAFVEKTIEVEGVVKDITFFNERYTVLLQGGDGLSCIMCDMQEDQIEELNLIKRGDKIVLKGICKGYLMDAILLNCIIPTKTDE